MAQYYEMYHGQQLADELKENSLAVHIDMIAGARIEVLILKPQARGICTLFRHTMLSI